MEWIFPLVNVQNVIEHGPVEIVDLPIKNGGSFLQDSTRWMGQRNQNQQLVDGFPSTKSHSLQCFRGTMCPPQLCLLVYTPHEYYSYRYHKP